MKLSSSDGDLPVPMSSVPLPIVTRAVGITPTERYLHTLCERSFLSLWSYPGIFRNQQNHGKGDGKEVCDLLVVFGDDILIFSDKSCVFPHTPDAKLNWSRWYRKAILASAEQAWGAERWIRDQPGRLFLDRACTQPFPLDLPPRERMRFHHIVVAHNIAGPCIDFFSSGSGTLIFDSDVTPEMQADPAACEPFRVGWFDHRRTFVHVLDDASLDILLATRDTITDFMHYLRAKESYLETIRSRNIKLFCTGEEELLAQYLLTLVDNEHSLTVPDVNLIMIPEGDWEYFRRSPERAAQVAADEVSYSWDALIEKFNQNILGGTSHFTTNPRIGDREKLMRFFAREPRVRRRMLAEALIGLIEKSGPRTRAIRVVYPSNPQDPHYCLLLMPKFGSVSDQQYRRVRHQFLEVCCYVTKLVCPDALDIIGLATENDIDRSSRSEDAMYLDARTWTPEMEAQALAWQQEFNLLTNLNRFAEKVEEFPRPEPTRIVPGPNPRNKSCPCGSGRKYKRCHGR
jgi:hypothetical protein